MTEGEQRRVDAMRRLRKSLGLFSDKCLKIKTKSATIIPFELNTAQKYVHQKLEQQLKEKGFIRALVLKGRQQGISTYVAARYYHKASMTKATNVYILAHEQAASDSLFSIVDRYHDNNPLAPSHGASNSKELTFDKLDSTYIVATAGQKAGGRSRTSTLFHGSEVGFWVNAPDHFASSVQTVADLPGTEVILESTANGPNGEFYEQWQQAEAGDSDYQAIFVPWFWQEEYRRACDDDFELSEETTDDMISEREYAEMFGLDDEQSNWRRNKIKTMRNAQLFDQEYPATAAMAFVNAKIDSYISALPILRARKRVIESAGPLIMGADPAGPGGDRFAIAGRRGHKVEYLKWRNKLETAEAYQWCKQVILNKKPARFNVDAGGIGAAVLSLLKNDDDIPKGVVKGINFGGRSQHKMARPDKPGPKNRRAEMWTRMKDWLEDPDELVQIPDIDALQGDLTAPMLKATLTNDIQLESKEEMRNRGVRSPDLGDAIALTFASLQFIKNYVDKPKGKQEYGNPDAVVNTPVIREPTPNGWMR